MKLADVAQAAGVPAAGFPEIEICGVAIDSRAVLPGSLFACLKGEKADGHDFIDHAVRGGASAILARHPLAGARVPVIVVDDVVRALGKIASQWRGRTSAKVIGITGTAGKTTLKESLASILARNGNTAKNPLNFNNQIGMPCSMLGCCGDEDFWIMEAGISRPGDMEELGAILGPDLAIILNVGQGHVAGLGKRGVAWHKSRFLSFVNPGGQALLSADYPALLEATSEYQVAKSFFSTRRGVGDYYIEGAGKNPGAYRLCLDGDYLEVQTPFCAEFGAETCIAAAAAAHILGLRGEAIQAGLAGISLPPHRFSPIQSGKWLLLDDIYNANPLSMRRMISAARQHADTLKKKLYLVLGEMGELGEDAYKLHQSLGEHIAHMSPQAVFWIGQQVQALKNGLANGGYMGIFAQVATPEDFLKSFDCARRAHPGMEAGGVMLFKGSRANRLENFLEALIGQLSVNKEKSGVL